MRVQRSRDEFDAKRENTKGKIEGRRNCVKNITDHEISLKSNEGL